MPKRYYSSKGVMWREHSNKYNDSENHDTSPMRAGPYNYDRQGSFPNQGNYEGPNGRRKLNNRNYYDGFDGRNDAYEGYVGRGDYDTRNGYYDGVRGGRRFVNDGSYSSDVNYDGFGGRRRQEMMDAGMIHEDHSKIANLPQGVMIKPYPRTGPYLPEDLDDTLRGVDEQINYDGRKRAEHFYPKKV